MFFLRKLKALCLSVVVLLLFPNCQPHSTPSDRLVVALDLEPQSLDPRKALDANGMRLVGLIFNGLVKVGPQLQAISDGAESWKKKDLVYEFYLKPLMFSSGRPVRSEDIEFSFKEFLKKGSFFHSAFKNIAFVRVFKKQNQLVVQIRLKKPSATFLSSDLPVIKILPKQESLQKSFFKKPIGTGAFRVVTKHSHEILLQRRILEPSYPRFLSFVIVRDSFTRVQKTLAGQVDVAPSVIPLEKISYFKTKDFYIKTQTGLSTTYLLINLKNPYLKKLKVRKALAHLINREEIIKFQMAGYALKSVSLLPPNNYFFNKQLSLPVFHVQKSLQITKDLNKKDLKFRFSCSNNKDTVDKAKTLISQINKGDFDIRLEAYEWGTFYKDLQQGQFDIALMKWVGVMDPDIYRLAFHSDNLVPRGRNRSFYKNPSLNRLMDQGVSLENLKARKALYNKVQDIISKDFVVIPLWHEKAVSIIKTDLKGYTLPANGDFSTLPLVRK